MIEHSTTGSLAAALRELADRLDAAGDQEIAPTYVDVDLQVAQYAAPLADRADTVARIAAALGLNLSGDPDDRNLRTELGYENRIVGQAYAAVFTGRGE